MMGKNERIFIRIGIAIAIILGVVCSIGLISQQRAYPIPKCNSITENIMVDIEAGISNFGRGDFWRKDTHFNDSFKTIWCEVGHSKSFSYSKYVKYYGTDFSNYMNRSIECLMEFTYEICKEKYVRS